VCVCCAWLRHRFTRISASSSLKDVTEVCRDVITVLENAKHKNQRITAIKLVESVMGKGAVLLRVKSLKSFGTGFCQQNIERVLIHLLLNGYVREDFHFTAYSTISYLLKGRFLDFIYCILLSLIRNSFRLKKFRRYNDINNNANYHL